MVFDGSVKGLNVGAPMTLRGVQVGQVTGIELVLDSTKASVIMMVEADLNAKNIRREGPANANLTEELIARGLRAQLNTQSLLTGLLYIELDFHPDSRTQPGRHRLTVYTVTHDTDQPAAHCPKTGGYRCFKIDR